MTRLVSNLRKGQCFLINLPHFYFSDSAPFPLTSINKFGLASHGKPYLFSFSVFKFNELKVTKNLANLAHFCHSVLSTVTELNSRFGMTYKCEFGCLGQIPFPLLFLCLVFFTFIFLNLPSSSFQCVATEFPDFP